MLVALKAVSAARQRHFEFFRDFVASFRLWACRIIYKLLDSLSGMLVDAAPAVQEEVVTGEVEILATFSTSVKKAISTSRKVNIAGCKVW